MVQRRKQHFARPGRRWGAIGLLALLMWLPALGHPGAIAVLHAQDATATQDAAASSTDDPTLSTDETTVPETVVLPPRRLYLPTVQRDGEPDPFCRSNSANPYTSVPIQGSPRSNPPPPVQDPDLNLAVRSYVSVSATLELIDIYGPTDEDAPQLAAIFRPKRLPTLTGAYQVYDWDWACPGAPDGRGCRGDLIADPAVTALGMATTPGEAIYPPGRRAHIYAGAYAALVLYAEPQRLTLAYTREDSPAWGYVIHLENICVDPNLLALYEEENAAGRRSLPALRSDDRVGTAFGHTVVVAVRDTGSFMDPRSAKDWWQETVRASLRAGTVEP